MSEQGNRGIVEQFWAAVNAKDWDAHDRLIDDGYVQEWPQSGERIRGKANSRAIIGAGDVWIIETTSTTARKWPKGYTCWR